LKRVKSREDYSLKKRKSLKKSEVYTYLGEKNEEKYNNRWKILKAS